MNQSNSSQAIEARNISIEESLLSRFDLIFELEDPMDPQLTFAVASHILDDEMNEKTEATEANWNHERLQMHIQVAKEVQVEISDDASEIIQQYFMLCKRNQEIEPSRRTMRLWKSLERLTMCHAKLMLRKKAVIDDAVSAVMLMESTWSFGHLLELPSVIRSQVPLGPTRAMTAEVLDKLNLNEMLERKLSQGRVKTSQNFDENAPFDKTIIDDIFNDGDDEEMKDPKVLSTQQMFSAEANNFQIPCQTSFPYTQSSQKFEPTKSFNESMNITSFKFPQSSSTQFGVTQAQEKKKSPFKASTNNEIKLESKEAAPKVDPLYSNLNFLAAFYTDKAAANTSTKSNVNFSTVPAVSVTQSPPEVSKQTFSTFSKPSLSSNAVSKLQKFQYIEEAQSQESNSQHVKSQNLIENVPLNSQKPQKVLLMQQSIEDIDVDEMDLYNF
jgi:MCM AAA-lid domain/MCM P-loop domain